MATENSTQWKKPTAAEQRKDREGIEENIRIRTAQLHYYQDCLKKQDKLLSEAEEAAEKANANLQRVIDLIRNAPDHIAVLEKGIESLKKTLHKKALAPKVAKLAVMRAKVKALEAELSKD